jgi:hypothetical protein
MTPTMFDAAPSATQGRAGTAEHLYNGVLALYGTAARGRRGARTWLRGHVAAAEYDHRPAAQKEGGLDNDPGRRASRRRRANGDGCGDHRQHGSSSQVSITVVEKDGKLGDWSEWRHHRLQQSGDGVSFTFAANALPWVLPTDAAEVHR